MLAAAATPSGSEAKASLIGLDLAGLERALAEAGEPEGRLRLRARQLFHWLYHRGATDLAAMTTLPKEMRASLAERFTAERPEIATEQRSADSTRKWLLPSPIGRRSRVSSSRRRTGERCASRPRSAAR